MLYACLEECHLRLFGRKIPRGKGPRLVAIGVAGVVLATFIVMVCSTLVGIFEVRRDISECNEAIAEKESELSRLEQKKAYYESDEFLEDSARNGGYVGEDETVFVVTN